jgi:hypothetical protein
MGDIKKYLLILILIISTTSFVYAISENDTKTDTSINSAIISQTLSRVNNQESNDVYAKYLDVKQTILEQKEQTYDTFLSQIQIILGLFALLFTLISVVAGIIFYKNIKEIKQEVKDELTIKMEGVLKKISTSEFQSIINETNDEITTLKEYLYKLQDQLVLHCNHTTPIQNNPTINPPHLSPLEELDNQAAKIDNIQQKSIGENKK